VLVGQDFSACNRNAARFRGGVVDDLPRLPHGDIAENALAHDERILLDLLGVPAHYGDCPESPSGGLVQVDRARLRAQQVLGMGGDALQDDVQLQRRGDLAPHLRDSRGFPAAALLGLEQAGVLDRNRGLVREETRHAQVLRAKRVGPGGLKDVDDADHAILPVHGDAQQRNAGLFLFVDGCAP